MKRLLPAALVLLLLASLGCRSPYYADRGAAAGALGGAGVGTIVGDAVGDTAAGALIGAGVGAVTGSAVGSAIDESMAQNRAEIAAQLGRQVAAGAASKEEVIAMTQSGVDPRLIQNYVRTSGVMQPLSAQDVIYLHQNGVATDVIQAMQTPTAPPAFAVGQPVAAPVIVEEHYYRDPYCWGPPLHYHGPHWGHRSGPRVSWGVSFVK